MDAWVIGLGDWVGDEVCVICEDEGLSNFYVACQHFVECSQHLWEKDADLWEVVMGIGEEESPSTKAPLLSVATLACMWMELATTMKEVEAAPPGWSSVWDLYSKLAGRMQTRKAAWEGRWSWDASNELGAIDLKGAEVAVRSRIQRKMLEVADELMDRFTKGSTDLQHMATDDPFSKLIEEVDSVKITKARAKELFLTFCASPKTNAFHELYNNVSTMQDDCGLLMSHTTGWDVLGAEDTAKYRDLVKGCEQKFFGAETVCGALTAMVALWRSLTPGVWLI